MSKDAKRYSNPRLSQTLITVDLAKRLLANNKSNRKIKHHHLDRLCEEIRSGRWKFNGDAIRVAVDGNLLDGQHRLEAVVATNTPIHSVLIEDLPVDVYDTIDSGSKRTAGDVLYILGEKNPRSLAASLIVVDDLLRSGDIVSRSASNAQVVGLINKYPAIRDSLRWGDALKRLAPPSVVTALHYIFSVFSSPEKADTFFEFTETGINLTEWSPIYLLRQRLINNATSKSKLDKRYITALIIKAWNAWIKGQKIGALRFRELGNKKESFPAICCQTSSGAELNKVDN
jgi:hypothetical protein